MKLLISFGGNPNAMDTEKWTPLVNHLLQFGLMLTKVIGWNEKLIKANTMLTIFVQLMSPYFFHFPCFLDKQIMS
jgi:hypothetical protein